MENMETVTDHWIAIENAMKIATNQWISIIDVWRSGQEQLPGVQRWKKYDKPMDGSKVRVQNSLQHSYSITLLGKIVCMRLDPYVKLDHLFLMTSLLLHDHGEGEIQQDTVYIDKTNQGDLDEYLAFKKRFEQLGDAHYNELEKAFLLQFVSKPFEHFPQKAQNQMRYLQTQYLKEAYAFDAVERWDYLLYAVEQYYEFGNFKILVQTLRHQIPHLDRLAEILPGFCETIWTYAIRFSFVEFLQLHEDKWIEEKGEK